MLGSQNPGRRQHSDLTTRTHRSKDGSDCNFCLSKTDISANKTIHRARALDHISGHCLEGFALVCCGRIGKFALKGL
jgi:hypothetical protein